MAEERSETNCWRSRFGGGWVRSEQYLAENMVARLATRDRIQLAHRFWTNPRWDKEFQRQAIHASRLLKEYPIEAIIAALRTTRGKQIYSLGLKSALVPLIKYEQDRLNTREVAAEVQAKVDPKPATPAEQPKTVEAQRAAFVPKNNLLSKLRNL